MRSHTELIINSRLIVCPSPLISFFKVAFPFSSSLAQIYFGLLLSLNQHPFILQVGSSLLRSRMGDFASTSCSSVVLVGRSAATLRRQRMNIRPRTMLFGVTLCPRTAQDPTKTHSILLCCYSLEEKL